MVCHAASSGTDLSGDCSWIAGLMGATTHSQSDRIVTGRYSAFLIITQFIIFSMLGVLVQIGRWDV